MGDRAHLVVFEDGDRRSFYSQWAGHDFELELLPGPEAALTFATAQQPADGWVLQEMCVGAAIIDCDARRLLWFSRCRSDYAYRSAVFAVLARTWPDWHVEWAYDGLADIVSYVGIDPAKVRGQRTIPIREDIRTPERFHAALPNFRLDPEVYPPGCELPPELPIWPPGLCPSEDEVEILVTVAGGGVVRAYAAGPSIDAVVGGGPRSLETYATWEPITTLPHLPPHGVHLDTDAKTAGVWTSYVLDQLMDDAVRLWPGWTWEFWRDRHTEQTARAGTAVRVPEPDAKAGLRRLAGEFRDHQDNDPAVRNIGLLLTATGMLTSAAAREGLENHTVVDNAFSHTPVDMSSADIERVNNTINDLLTAM